MNDPQRRRVYAMERREFRAHLLHCVALKALRSAARRVCTNANVPQVRVYVRAFRGSGGEYWCMADEPARIYLHPKVGRNFMSLAHELAHHVAWIKSPRSDPHGPTWMWWYAAIMDAMRLVPFEGTLAICKRHGVAIAPVGAVKQPSRT